MKNKNIRTSLFSLVIMLSVFSYAFLQTIESPTLNIDPAIEIESMEIENLSTQETIMPDVKIVKTAAEFLKNMLPISQ